MKMYKYGNGSFTDMIIYLSGLSLIDRIPNNEFNHTMTEANP